MPLRRFVLDTNIYRYTAAYPDFESWVRGQYTPVSASSVVLSELWRSAQGAALRRYVLMIERQLRHLVFAPSHRDWRQVGEYLSTRLPRDGRRPSPELLNTIRKEQNDALIALSSWNLGYVVITCDDDFERIRDWAKPPAGSLVRLPAPTPPAGGQP